MKKSTKKDKSAGGKSPVKAMREVAADDATVVKANKILEQMCLTDGPDSKRRAYEFIHGTQDEDDPNPLL